MTVPCGDAILHSHLVEVLCGRGAHSRTAEIHYTPKLAELGWYGRLKSGVMSRQSGPSHSGSGTLRRSAAAWQDRSRSHEVGALTSTRISRIMSGRSKGHNGLKPGCA